MVFQVSLDEPDSGLPHRLAYIEPITEYSPPLARAGVITGDREETFTYLYNQYNRKICTYLVRFVGDTEIGKELAQETFFKAWQALPNLRDPSRVEAWLFRIARNKAMDYLRRKKLRPILFPWTTIEEKDIPDEASFDTIDTIEHIECVKQALAQVTPKYRECLILFVFVGLKQKEIAKIVGIKENSVSVYVGYGLKEFDKAYEKLKGE